MLRIKSHFAKTAIIDKHGQHNQVRWMFQCLRGVNKHRMAHKEKKKEHYRVIVNS